MKSIQNHTIELRAKVFPNPFSQQLFINFSETILEDISVKIFDLNARIIYRQEFSPLQNIQLRIHDISNGTYFLKVNTGQRQFNTKLIKN
jgi:hypothetical protein